MSSNQQIEEQLVAGLRRIDAPYRQALSILDEVSLSETGSRSSIANHLKIPHKLQPSMQIIAACEEQLVPLRQQWRDLGQKPGVELQGLLSSQSDLLKRLIESLNAAEGQMVSEHSEMGLKLDKSRTHVVARAAYQHESA
ncbi:MAG: hypothetical protein ABJZ55_23760 [Fuerstiella sp.]